MLELGWPKLFDPTSQMRRRLREGATTWPPPEVAWAGVSPAGTWGSGGYWAGRLGMSSPRCQGAPEDLEGKAWQAGPSRQKWWVLGMGQRPGKGEEESGRNGHILTPIILMGSIEMDCHSS